MLLPTEGIPLHSSTACSRRFHRITGRNTSRCIAQSASIAEPALLLEFFFYMHPDTIHKFLSKYIRVISKAEQDILWCHPFVVVLPEQFLEFSSKVEVALRYFVYIWVSA